ncbi:MAG: carbohydrate kinase family protein [Armatimonadota bacterium]
MSEVVCLGILVADVYGRPIDEWPERGRLSTVDDMGIGLGGCAANTGLSLVKLGVDTAIMGKVGDDGFGRFVSETLEAAGADVRGLVVDDRPGTSATMVIIDSLGERTFLHYPGANGRLRCDEIGFGLMTDCRIFHCAGALVMGDFDGEPMAQCLRAAKEAGVTTSLDTVYNDKSGWMDKLEPCLRYTDVFLPSLHEAQKLTGADDPETVAERLLSYGLKVVGLKMGEEGSYIRTPDQELRVPAYKFEAIDGTGAGDAFVAGFLRGMLEEWDLERTTRFANAVGGLCTTGLGTTSGVRSFADTLEFLKTKDPDYWQA